jgi:hypothetical protein
MPEWIPPAVWVSFATLIGVIYRIVSRRLDDVERRCLNTDQAVLAERVGRLQRDYEALEKFRDELLTKKLDQLMSDAYGTMANHKAEADRRLGRLEDKVFNGLK